MADEQPSFDAAIARPIELALALCLLASTGCDLSHRINDYVDDDYPLRITQRTEVFSTPDRAAMLNLDHHPPALTVLQPGERVTVIGHRYGKDYLAYQIRLPDGRFGYFLFRGSKVETTTSD